MQMYPGIPGGRYLRLLARRRPRSTRNTSQRSLEGAQNKRRHFSTNFQRSLRSCLEAGCASGGVGAVLTYVREHCATSGWALQLGYLFCIEEDL